MIAREEAARVAALAKLEMTGDELDRAAADLTAILDYVAELDAVDTSAVDPEAAPLTLSPLREDEPRPSLDRGDAFANAPDADRDAGLFRVPRVLGS
jgi:aspartyl-tRNA(Asn)/glutamyl-tRNA(Gln) amidotransferase subunit C